MARFVDCENKVVELEVDEDFSLTDACGSVEQICADGGNAIDLGDSAEIGTEVCVVGDGPGVTVSGAGLDPPFPVAEGQVCCFTFSCTRQWRSSCERPCECVVQSQFARVSEATEVSSDDGLVDLLTVPITVTRGDKLRVFSGWAYAHSAAPDETAATTSFRVTIVSGPAFVGQTIESGIESTDDVVLTASGAIVSEFPRDDTALPPGTYVLALQAQTSLGTMTINGSTTTDTAATLLVQEVDEVDEEDEI